METRYAVRCLGSDREDEIRGVVEDKEPNKALQRTADKLCG